MQKENKIEEAQNPDLRVGSVTCRLIGGVQDTRRNNEDFAITPYLFGIWVTGKIIKVRGIGICWGYYSVYFGFGWNMPPKFPSFKVLF